MIFARAPLRVDGRRMRRQRSPDLPLIKCPEFARLYRILPLAVTFTRFFKPLCVFIFGMPNTFHALTTI